MSKPENTAKHDDAGTTEIYSVKEDAAKNELADYEMKSSKGTIDDINEARALVEANQPILKQMIYPKKCLSPA